MRTPYYPCDDCNKLTPRDRKPRDDKPFRCAKCAAKALKRQKRDYWRRRAKLKASRKGRRPRARRVVTDSPGFVLADMELIDFTRDPI